MVYFYTHKYQNKIRYCRLHLYHSCHPKWKRIRQNTQQYGHTAGMDIVYIECQLTLAQEVISIDIKLK